MANRKCCTKCGKNKKLTSFYKDKRTIDGLEQQCKKCRSKNHKKYRLTKKGLVTSLYNHQKQSSKQRWHKPPKYTLQELKIWMFEQDKFHKLYKKWKKSGYKISLKPSCDRTNDFKRYSLKRLQLMTWDENDIKHHQDVKNGIDTRTCKAVIGINIQTGKKVKFYSVAEAARQVGVHRGNIGNCCRGKIKTAGGFYWKYKLN